MAHKFFRDGLEELIDDPPKVVSTPDGHTVEIYKVKGKTKYFVTLAGSFYCAHGATIADAVADATWKDEKKRPSLDALKEDIREAGKDRQITINEFRVLTGACREGCLSALKKAGLDGSPMTAPEIVNHFPDWGRKLMQVLEW